MRRIYLNCGVRMKEAETSPKIWEPCWPHTTGLILESSKINNITLCCHSHDAGWLETVARVWNWNPIFHSLVERVLDLQDLMVWIELSWSSLQERAMSDNQLATPWLNWSSYLVHEWGSIAWRQTSGRNSVHLQAILMSTYNGIILGVIHKVCESDTPSFSESKLSICRSYSTDLCCTVL